MELNVIHNIDCRDGMKKYLPDNSVDLFCCSPPYSVGIPYSHWNDAQPKDEYLQFTKEWLQQIYRSLKVGGRGAINIPYEVNMMERGGRVFLVAEYWSILKEIGFGFGGLIDLTELQSHRKKMTAWGSWLSPSAPCVYNPKECIILVYKEQWKREDSEGKNSWFDSNPEEAKKEFMRLVCAEWEYMAETRKLSEANYSESIPSNVLKLLSYEGDVVVDPFMGSGTTGLVCKNMNRNYIGFEISPDYHRRAVDRIEHGLEVDYKRYDGKEHLAPKIDREFLGMFDDE